MKAGEFVRRVSRLGRTRGAFVRFVARRGKGSHGTLYYGERFTVVPDRKKELPQGTLTAMTKQLGLKKSDLIET